MITTTIIYPGHPRHTPGVDKVSSTGSGVLFPDIDIFLPREWGWNPRRDSLYSKRRVPTRERDKRVVQYASFRVSQFDCDKRATVSLAASDVQKEPTLVGVDS
ncbi:hypothetical protein CDAR_172551 [Caerostris darwini]|uniref:Uncharacterized protein n=1 Tax=Caerostris darwini TaxID=1538125 RepID=A0AAV4MFK8_9ARAC|nr:hypothetical protein CDAR_172551 [Caerostris darwini]